MSATTVHPRGFARRVVCLIFSLLVGACGGRHETGSTPDAPSTSAGDTVRVEAAGRTIVIPAPDGMVDFLSATGRRAPPASSGGGVVGVFVRRDQLHLALRNAGPRDLTVMAAVPAGNSFSDVNNATRFEAQKNSWVATGRQITDPGARRIATELERWTTGAQSSLDDPLPRGDTVAVRVESPDARRVQLLTVGHNQTAEFGEYDLHSSALVFVRGRVLECSE